MPVWFKRITLALILLLAGASVTYAQTRREIVHVFSGGSADGAMPEGGLAFGADGNLYGTTTRGGAFDKGTVFRLTPSGALTVLHSFAGGQDDGATPASAPALAGDGNFYGTTLEGGSATDPGFGTVFRISPDGTYAVLHRFDGSEGASPFNVIVSSDGDLYGTTSGGGAHGLGIAFRMTRAGVLTILHEFAPVLAVPYDDIAVAGALVEGPDGAFYGTTVEVSGPNSFVFRMSRDGSVTYLHAFPTEVLNGGLLLANDGNLYGTTRYYGGDSLYGSVYRITLSGDVTPLSSFPYSGNPPGAGDLNDRKRSALIQGADGSLYGMESSTAPLTNNFVPSAFRVTLPGSFTRMYSFPKESAPRPYSEWRSMPAPLLQAPDGSFYGVTEHYNGGSAPSLGCVFRLISSPNNGFDHDAISDMPLYDAATGTWRILTSSSGYVSSMRIFWGGPEYTPVPADYDGDGRLDAAVYHGGRGLWYVLTSSSNFTTILIKAWGGVGYTPVPEDFNNDQRADFALYYRKTGRWYVQYSSGGSLGGAVGGAGYVPVRGDFDGDNIADMSAYAPATGRWEIGLSLSRYGPRSFSLGGPGYAPVVGDYDGDRKTDLAVYNEATGSWVVKTASSDFEAIWTLGWGGTGYTAIPGDYDGDGKNDLAVYRAATGEWFVLQSSTGFTTTLYVQWGGPGDIVVTLQAAQVAWTDATRATDYDGDGRSDIAVYEPATGTWSIRESSTNFTTARTIVWGAAGDTPVPGDYDGDGRTDVATFNDATGSWFAKLTSGSVLNAILGGPGDVPLARDYDGDFITDIAVYTPSTGGWRLLLSSSHFTATTTVTWGGAAWTAVPVDYDGDGRADLGLYEESTGFWRILLAANGFTTNLAFNWGGTGYTVASADYDGDGKADFGVCFNATGQWYAVTSGAGYTTVLARPWGAPVDTPRSGDYDGDGIADMVSYDSTTGEWYLLLSSSYFTLRIERTVGGTGYIVPR